MRKKYAQSLLARFILSTDGAATAKISGSWGGSARRVRSESFSLHETGFSYGSPPVLPDKLLDKLFRLLLFSQNISVHRNFSSRDVKVLMGCDWRSCLMSSLPCYHFNHFPIYISALVLCHPLLFTAPAIHVYTLTKKKSFLPLFHKVFLMLRLIVFVLRNRNLI